MAEPDRYRVLRPVQIIVCIMNMLLTILSAAINANANSSHRPITGRALVCKLTLVYCVTVVASHCYTSLKIQMIRYRSFHNSREFTTDIVASVCISPDATQRMNILPGRCFVLALADFDHYNMRTVFLS